MELANGDDDKNVVVEGITKEDERAIIRSMNSTLEAMRDEIRNDNKRAG